LTISILKDKISSSFFISLVTELQFDDPEIEKLQLFDGI